MDIECYPSNYYTELASASIYSPPTFPLSSSNAGPKELRTPKKGYKKRTRKTIINRDLKK